MKTIWCVYKVFFPLNLFNRKNKVLIKFYNKIYYTLIFRQYSVFQCSQNIQFLTHDASSYVHLRSGHTWFRLEPQIGHFFSFTLNTKPLGILTPNMRNKKCHLEGPLYTFWHVPEFYSPEVGSVGFPETSQLYNWLVWKCTATVDLGIFFNQTCDLNALPDNLNRNLNDASKQKFDALLVAVFILIIIMCFV